MNWMLLKLFRVPIFLCVFSIVILLFATHAFDGLANNQLLTGISDLLTKGISILSIVLFSTGILWGAYCGYRLWQWGKGSGDFCHNCGGMTEEMEGRYGPYHKCLLCGKNRGV